MKDFCKLSDKEKFEWIPKVRVRCFVLFWFNMV